MGLEDFGDVRAERAYKYQKQTIGVIHKKVGPIVQSLSIGSIGLLSHEPRSNAVTSDFILESRTPGLLTEFSVKFFKGD